MAKKIVSLYIDDGSIRLLLTDNKRIKKWAYLPLEPGLVKDTVIIKETELATEIQKLLRAQKIKAKKVIVGLSGRLCLTRHITLPQLPKTMLAEAVMQEAKRTLPIPLEQLYLTWQVIPGWGSKTQVFLVALRRKTADAMLTTLHKAGLRPYFLDLKPLALARVVKERTAIILDVQPTEFDIVIMAEGIPHPVRTVSFPSEALTWQEKLPMIKEDLDRTIKFYNSNNEDKPLTPSTPIFVSGELVNEPELRLLLSDELGYPVLLLSSPLQCPEGFALSHFMVNIGLALKELPLGEETGLSVANLNALPDAYRPKPLSLTRVLILPGSAAFIGLAVPLMMLVQSASANIEAMHSHLDITNQLVRQKQLEKRELVQNIAQLEQELVEAEASRDAFTTALTGLDGQDYKISRDLETVTSALPSAISLAKINHDGNILTIYGQAPGEAEVLAYARGLKESGRFREIIIATMAMTEDEGMDFTLVIRSKG